MAPSGLYARLCQAFFMYKLLILRMGIQKLINRLLL